MEISIFMDEASRTGQQRYNGKKWNFKDQPYFGLGALYISTNKIETLHQELETAIRETHIQGEFKWQNKSARNKASQLYSKLMEIIIHNGANVHFEIEDKRFTIAKTITEYCVLPYYDMSSDMLCDNETKYIKRAFASYIADNLSDSLLWEACAFFDSTELSTTELKRLIYKIMVELDTKAIREYCLETIDSIEKFENGKLPLQLHNLFPVRDTIKHNRTKSTLTIDPHTDCFSDLLCNSVKYFPECRKFQCIHDEQDQWMPALEEAIMRMRISYPNYSFVFSTEKGYHAIINTVDYILGYLNWCLRELFDNNQCIPQDIQDLFDSHLTLVASASLQEALWTNNPEVKVVKALSKAVGMK